MMSKSKAFLNPLALLLLAPLAACAPPAAGMRGQAGGAGAPVVVAPPPSGPVVTPPAAESPPPPSPPTVAELAADPGRFKGLAGREVVALLGDPSFRRSEAPAEVWQYYGPGCVLDLFLYLDHGVQQVAHAELRSRAAGPANACLADILDRRRD